MNVWKNPPFLAKESPLYPAGILLNVLLVTFCSIIAAVATIVGEGTIRGDLALNERTSAWLTTINLLGINTVVPAANWFADRFGYKTMFCFGSALFTFATVIAGVSYHFPILAVARLLEGMGSGFVFPVGLALLAQNISPQRLPLALIAYVCLAFGLGFAIGLPFAGYCTQFLSWRAIFLSIAPISFFSFLFCALLQHDTPRQTKAPFDFWGWVFFASFIGSLLVALTYGPMDSTDAGWFSPFILLCFFVAGASLIVTILIERNHENPLIPLVLFHNPLYSITCVVMFLLGMSYFASAATMIQYMIEALLYERYESGKIGITYGLSLSFFSLVAAILMKKVPLPIIVFTGLGFLTYSYFFNNTLDWLSGPDQIFPILLLRGIGLGLALGPATVQALGAVPKELKDKAATLLTFFRQVGGTYGSTLISIIVIKRTIFHLARFGEQSQSELPGFQVTYQKLYMHYHSTFFDSGAQSDSLAKATIIQNIQTQAFIQALSDATIVFGYITLGVGLTLLVIKLWQYTQVHSKV